MTAPRLEIDLDKVHDNARMLIERLGARGIAVTGVTKATLGSPDVAIALVRAGVAGIGDSRIENIERMREAGVAAPMTLIRSPMLSQVDRVVEHADVSCNTEPEVIAALSASAAARGRIHRIVLMVELGDLREGIMPADLDDVVRRTLGLRGLVLHGIGTNLACQSGVAPDATNMAELSALAAEVESTFGIALAVVTGGNSASIEWALGADDRGRVDDLRLGESILLGCEPLHRQPIEGLHTDAFTLVAEVIEAKVKPSLPRGVIGQAAFGVVTPATDRGDVCRAILAVGRQDVDPAGLRAPPGIEIDGASSDHLVVESGAELVAVGTRLTFGLDYSALVRAMTSPSVTKVMMSVASADRAD